MKQWRKVLAVILSFVVVTAGTNYLPKTLEAAGTPQFGADAVTAKPGEEIEIPVWIHGNTGIMGLGLDIKFDKEVLTPIDDVKATSLLVGQFNDSVEGTLSEGTDNFKVMWQGTDAMAEDGDLFTLKFQVSGSASGSTEITLGLLEDDTFDGDFSNVAVVCQPITVTIDGGEADTPTLPPAPTDVPDEPTEEPDATPAPKVEWDGEPFLVFMYFYGKDYTDGQHADVEVNGDGEYSISFKAEEQADDIQRLELYVSSWLKEFPVGLKVVPTQMQVGDKLYPIGDCVVEQSDVYTDIWICDLYSEVNCIVGKPVIPVKEGDTVKVTFQVMGLGVEGSLADRPLPTPVPSENPNSTAQPLNTENPSVPQVTAAPGGQNPGAGQTVTQGTTVANNPGSQSENKTVPGEAFRREESVKTPGKVALKSVKKAGRRKLKVTWKSVSNAYEYEIQYALNRKFTKKKKTKYVYSTKATITGLKSKKKYYVRVRALNYAGMHGAWSKVKKCKVK